MTLKRFPSSIRSNYFTNAVEQDFLLAHASDRIGRGSNDMRARLDLRLLFLPTEANVPVKTFIRCFVAPFVLLLLTTFSLPWEIDHCLFKIAIER